MFTQFYVIGPRGDSIIFRNFRNEINQPTAETFFRNVRFYDGKKQEAPPIFNVDGLHYFWVRRNGLYFVLTAIVNTSPSLGLELLIRVTRLFKDYCGVLTEESVRTNFTLVYEVLDEVFDYGIPQNTTNDSLKPYVFNEPVVSHKPTIDNSIIKLPLSFSSKTVAASSTDVPLSFQNKDQGNRVYIDLYERITYCVNSNGVVLQQLIDGSVQMKSYVPGAPPMVLQFNEDLITNSFNRPTNASPYSVELDDYNFHECVQYDNFDQTKSVIIKPREGEVNIMNYRITPVTIKLPFKIFPHLELLSSHKLELIIKFRADYPLAVSAGQVLVHIPMPSTTTSVSLDSKQANAAVPSTKFEHSAEYDTTDKLVKWRMRKLPGGTELMLICRISLSEPHTTFTRKEIGQVSVMFEIPMYNTSSIQIKSLRPVNQRIQPPQRYVRYITRSTSYTCRM